MTTNEVIYSIIERVRQYSDDSDITEDYVLFQVNLNRALFLRNEYNKRNRTVDEEVKQIICSQLVIADPADCGCAVGQTDCYILRTKDKMPSFIELHERNAVFAIRPGSNKLAFPFVYTTHNRALHSGKTSRTQNTIYAFLYPDGYIYFKSSNKKILALEGEFVSISAILENPVEAALYTDCATDSPCYDKSTTKYPIKAHMLAYLTDKVVKDISLSLGIPQDKANDADESVEGMAQQQKIQVQRR